jgi:hypothetical protein
MSVHHVLSRWEIISLTTLISSDGYLALNQNIYPLSIRDKYAMPTCSFCWRQRLEWSAVVGCSYPADKENIALVK